MELINQLAANMMRTVSGQESKPHDEREMAMLDENALRVNQAMLIILLLAAFVFNLSILALFVGAVMALGTLIGVPGFKPVYQYILKPMNIVKPRMINDNPEPHRFAQGVGAVCTFVGVLFLFLGKEYIGWGLIWLVILLAGVNLLTGFCAGCFLHYWLNRIMGRN